MANSRSNIYPVKLQGAELNLNKFDAEIKQYSGFNKNNSPFVGGCLSNLFTKSEENTTGSSDSVYVDDNGDVYTVDAEGFYKNGNLIFGHSAYTDRFLAFEKEQITEIPDDAVYARVFKGEQYNDVFYITKRQTLNDIVFDIHSHSVDCTFVPSYLGGQGSLEDITFDAEKINNRFYIVARCNFFVEGESVNKYKYYAMYAEDSSLTQLLNDESLQVNNKTEDRRPDAKPVVFIENGYVYFLFNQVTQVDGVNNFYTPVATDNIQVITYNLDTQDDSLVLWTNSQIGYRRYSSYVFLKNRCAYFVGSVNNRTLAAGERLILKCRITFNAGVISFTSENLIATPIYSSEKTFNNSRFVGKQYYIGRYGAVYGIEFRETSSGENNIGCGICDYKTNFITYQEQIIGGRYDLILGAVAGGFILVNNGIVTGLSLPISDYLQTGQFGYGEILATEWNSVDEDSISTGIHSNYFYSRDIVYRDINNKKWYRIYLTEACPKIKKVNNQLVLNVLTGEGQPYNAYRLTDGALLKFASAWNNRAPAKEDDNLYYLYSENKTYIATSQNEYSLEDNASLLLNPVPCVVVNSYNLFHTNKEFTNNFNFYNTSNSEIIYRASFFDFVKTNRDLLGLPFPINTSGNVQLSPSLFCKTERFGNDVFIKEGSNAYQLIKDGAESVMSYYLGTLIENLEDIFILQGQYYAIINKQIFNVQFSGGVVQSLSFVVSVENLQFCGNSAYQAYFFSKTNRCIYVFTGANILNQLQLVDKISEIYAYKYNQSTQSIILITDIGTIVSSNLGMYLIEGFTPDDVFFYDKGVVFVSDSELTYLQYYEADGFEKHNIEVETCFYGMNNETVTINDCLYFRLFSEEHEEGEVKVSATTISLKGRKTETTVFKFKASDWDALTHSVYVRYQPKEQRGLGISFSINSPFKIASLSVGSKADAILVDKVSKGAVITPSNNDEW